MEDLPGNVPRFSGQGRRLVQRVQDQFSGSGGGGGGGDSSAPGPSASRVVRFLVLLRFTPLVIDVRRRQRADISPAAYELAVHTIACIAQSQSCLLVFLPGSSEILNLQSALEDSFLGLVIPDSGIRLEVPLCERFAFCPLVVRC